jgi:carbon storage regulator
MLTPKRNRRRGFTQGGTFMLVLSRKIGERILVPHCELAFTVLAVDGKTVRLGISAPDEVEVYREEVWQQLCQQTNSPPARG